MDNLAPIIDTPDLASKGYVDAQDAAHVAAANPHPQYDEVAVSATQPVNGAELWVNTAETAQDRDDTELLTIVMDLRARVEALERGR